QAALNLLVQGSQVRGGGRESGRVGRLRPAALRLPVIDHCHSPHRPPLSIRRASSSSSITVAVLRGEAVAFTSCELWASAVTHCHRLRLAGLGLCLGEPVVPSGGGLVASASG